MLTIRTRVGALDRRKAVGSSLCVGGGGARGGWVGARGGCRGVGSVVGRV